MKKHIVIITALLALLLVASCDSKNKPATDNGDGNDIDAIGADDIIPDGLPEKDGLPEVEAKPDDDVVAFDEDGTGDEIVTDEDTVDDLSDQTDQTDQSDESPDETLDETVDVALDETVDEDMTDDQSDQTDLPDPVDEDTVDDQSDQTDQSDESPDETADETVDVVDLDIIPVDIDIIVTCEDDGVACTTELIVGGQCRHIAQHDECGLGELCDQTEGCRPASGWACITCPDGVGDCAHTTDICGRIRLTADPFCLTPCTYQSECLDGFTCTEIFDELDQSLGFGCVPDNSVCCMNFDGDSSGIGADCSAQDCDESDASVYPGALEICNGRDDNCVDGVDEGVLGPYCEEQDGACFGARHSCDGANGWAVCTDTEYAGNSADWQSVETWCDSIDNDCNGQIDEPFAAELYKVCSAGIGVCLSNGVTLCADDKLSVECGAEPKPAPEAPEELTCDNKDNNCDGQVDEPWNRNVGCTADCKGDLCYVGEGVCRATGVRVCLGGGTTCSATAGIPDPSDLTGGIENKCDDIDNDCDGEADQPWNRHDGICDNPNGCKNEVCYAGVGACRTAGILVCNATQEDVECNAVEGTPAETEFCNNLDDDCDGEVDEGFAAKNQPCSLGVGECLRNGVTICAPDQLSVVCGAVPGDPIAERCDGLDNNCADGVDEPWPLKNTPCSNGLAGACERTGIYVCTGDKSGIECNAPIIAGTPEQCDGIDNNCAGGVDETWPLKNTACSNGLEGACERPGIYVCTGDKSGIECNAPIVTGTAEVCDGIDNNCAGGVDETWPLKNTACSNGQVGACERTGIYVCTGDKSGIECNAPIIAGTPEQCDGIDNNCAGGVDETWPLKNTACSNGLEGACERPGIYVCTGDKSGIECNAPTINTAGLTESCNGIDDDCDGEVDEPWIRQEGICDNPNGCKNEVCSVGEGVCLATGIVVCNGDGSDVMCNAVEGDPGTENLCDGLDNDCNGSVDETWLLKNTACSNGQVGACERTGMYVCTGDKSGIECNAPIIDNAGFVETCNAIDDDCNGTIDDPWTRHEGTCDNPEGCKSDVCYDGVGACRQAGILVCNGDEDEVECNAVAGIPSLDDPCNGLDDNCNGEVDEAYAADKGKACSVGTGECLRNGITVCNGDGDGVVCNATEGSPAAELCDGLDNNCVGGVDEPWPAKNTVCSNGLAGACERPGIYVCNGAKDGLECNAPIVSGTPEQCDGIDNDCVNGIDDLWPLKGTACTNGLAGACARSGVYVCNGDKSGIECNAPSASGTSEVCDGIDNDCTGGVDNGLTGALCANQTGVCAGTRQSCGGTAGWLVCGPTQYAANVNGTYEQNETLCDGKDNDCDGSSDENVASYAPLCPLQAGVCKDARQICGGASGWLACTAGSYGGNYAADENSCDYLDNDCDGTVDEGYLNGGKYTLNTACGDCSTNCAVIYNKPNGYGTCNSTGAPVCQLTCNSGYFDLNGIPDDGCEFALEASVIYVSTADAQALDDATCGLGPIGTGAGNHPCKTITHGLTRAGETGRGNLHVADGLYNETVILVNGVSLYGGYKADTWERHLTSTLTVWRGNTTAYEPHKATVIALNITSTTVLEGFVIYGQAATGTGGNSYAMYVSGCDADLTIRYNTIYGATGGPGADGSAGSAGAAGGNGVGRASNPAGYDSIYSSYDCGGWSCCDSSDNRQYANGGTNGSCSNANGGAGGGNTCSPVNNTPTSGAPGGNGQGTGGGAGGLEGYDMTFTDDGSTYYCNEFSLSQSKNGFNGVDGATGTEGSGGGGALNATGGIAAGHWVGGGGVAGGTGTVGGGGGGGGAGGGSNSLTDYDDMLGAHGGGGGAGGCGATGATAGTYGGGSFGIFLINTTAPTLQNNIIVIGTGGTGGKGGNGGIGGVGGNGGDGGIVGTTIPRWCSGNAGKGGKGGRGGHGGGGGGGAGGVALGVALNNVTAAPDYTTNNSFNGGAGGAGGTGGASLGNPGSTGVTGYKASVYDFGGAYCGNGVIDGGEACDLGTGNGKCSTCDTNCTVRAANVCNDNYTCGNETCDNGGDTSGCVACVRQVPATATGSDNALFVSWTGVPTSIKRGTTFTFSITMQNTGSLTWDAVGGDPHNLGSQSPQDTGTWGTGRIGLGASTVAPGASFTFTFTATAPATPGTYPFQWRMVHDAVQWFGGYTPIQSITVTY